MTTIQVVLLSGSVNNRLRATISEHEA